MLRCYINSEKRRNMKFEKVMLFTIVFVGTCVTGRGSSESGLVERDVPLTAVEYGLFKRDVNWSSGLVKQGVPLEAIRHRLSKRTLSWDKLEKRGISKRDESASGLVEREKDTDILS